MKGSFWKNKKVFITGHTGFKGSWLCAMLHKLEAEITGYALAPNSEFNLFEIVYSGAKIDSIEADIRDADLLICEMQKRNPEIVIHMAAQSLVTESYKSPAYTYDVNVMGTVSVLEAIRHCGSVRSFVNVTTDKVYKNNEWVWGYRENDALDGHEPYSNSKSCSELVTYTYKRSFLEEVAISTCRAGNVIGGGDYAANRIVPDCVRAAIGKKEIVIRNPGAVRPYQHVLEPLFAYVLIAQMQWDDPTNFQGAYNIGPAMDDCVTTAKLADLFCMSWGDCAKWRHHPQTNAYHEANLLELDCSKARNVLNWKPVWNISTAVDNTVRWWKEHQAGGDMFSFMENQVSEYMEATYEV